MVCDSTSRVELATFLGVTFCLSAIWYGLIIKAGGLAHSTAYVFALMWSPAMGALVTQLHFRRTVRGLGLRWPAHRWTLLAYVLPLVYAAAAYSLVWLSGLGKLDLKRAPRSALAFVVLG